MTIAQSGRSDWWAGQRPACACSLKWQLLDRRETREVNKNPHYQGMCFVSLIASHLHCIYFMHEQPSDLEMGLIKSFQWKGKIALKTLPRCSCVQFRKITLGQRGVCQFNNGKGLGLWQLGIWTCWRDSGELAEAETFRPQPSPPSHQSWWLKLEIQTHWNSKVVSKNLLSFQIDCNKYPDLADEEDLCVLLVQTGNPGS